jgi:hypothetical protein
MEISGKIKEKVQDRIPHDKNGEKMLTPICNSDSVFFLYYEKLNAVLQLTCFAAKQGTKPKAPDASIVSKIHKN